jgi:hypothetical protein
LAALATFTRFRLSFDFNLDASHGSTTGQFVEDQQRSETPIWGYYSQNVFEMQDATGTFTSKERGLFGIHWINTTGGALDTTWIAADFAAAESAIQTFWTALSSLIAFDCRFVEHRWYPYGPAVVPPNPPTRITTLGTPLVGTPSPRGIHQQACTVTFRTALRRHWGRIYLPLWGVTLGSGATLTSGNADTIANAARTLATAPGTAQGIVPVVWNRNAKVAYGITDIEVDNVLDVVRRRRTRTTTYKKILSA